MSGVAASPSVPQQADLGPSRWMMVAMVIAFIAIPTIAIGIVIWQVRKNSKSKDDTPTTQSATTSENKPPHYKIRYLRLQRTDKQPEYVQVQRMALYNKNQLLPVVNGKVYPSLPNGVATWQMAVQGTDLAHTDISPDAHVEFDFGSDVEADRVQLIQRQDLADWNANRTKGVTFEALNAAKQIVLTYTITQPYTFELNFIAPETVPMVRMGK